MSARFLFLLAMFFGIALAPVQPVLACAPKVAAQECGQCCAEPAHACCVTTNAPGKALPALPATSHAEDGKQLAAPSLVVLCLSPTPAVECPSVQRQQATRLPARPLVDLHCIRLI